MKNSPTPNEEALTYTKVVELPSGVVETRVYNSEGKLVEIKRKQPEAQSYKLPTWLNRSSFGTANN